MILNTRQWCTNFPMLFIFFSIEKFNNDLCVNRSSKSLAALIVNRNVWINLISALYEIFLSMYRWTTIVKLLCFLPEKSFYFEYQYLYHAWYTDYKSTVAFFSLLLPVSKWSLHVVKGLKIKRNVTMQKENDSIFWLPLEDLFGKYSLPLCPVFWNQVFTSSHSCTM